MATNAVERARVLANRAEGHWGKLRRELERLDKLRVEIDAGVRAQKFTPQYGRDHLRQLREQTHQRLLNETETLIREIAATQAEATAYTPQELMRAARFADAGAEANFLHRLARSSREDLTSLATEAATAGDLARLREAVREARYRADTAQDEEARRTLIQVDTIVRRNPPPEVARAAAVFSELAGERAYVEQSLQALATGEADDSLRGRAAAKLRGQYDEMDRLGLVRRNAAMLGADNCVRLHPDDEKTLNAACEAADHAA